MTQEERNKLVNFCVDAVAYLEDRPSKDIDETVFTEMSDEDLIVEADWYDGILDK